MGILIPRLDPPYYGAPLRLVWLEPQITYFARFTSDRLHKKSQITYALGCTELKAVI